MSCIIQGLCQIDTENCCPMPAVCFRSSPCTCLAISCTPRCLQNVNNNKGYVLFACTIKEICDCEICQRGKGYALRHAPLSSPPEVSHPLKKVSTDLLTLPLTSRRNEYVLVLVDHLFRFEELIVLKKRTPETVA